MEQDVRICVHGLGYVGLATASLFANNGHDVVGYDVDTNVLDAIRDGDLSLPEEGLEEYVRTATSAGLTASEEVVSADYHLVCVPTPYNDGADLSFVEDATAALAPSLRAGDTVVLESTVPPGTTVDTVAPLLEASGLEAGEQFHVAYTPETILPGNTVPELRGNDRIVGGIDDASTDMVYELYEAVITGTVHRAPDATTAEFIKLSQNAFRDVNIAFANELALLADDYGIEARQAIDLANTHPRVEILNPGPGVGGHCLPVDPLFLAEHSDRARLVECARRVNDSMPGHVVDKLRAELGPLTDRRIAVLGVAYKGNVDEIRNSPGLAVTHALRAAGMEPGRITDGGSTTVSVSVTDPHVQNPLLELTPLEQALAGADAAVVTAAHDEYRELDPERMKHLLHTNVVVDAVDVLDRSTWEEHGLTVVDL